MKSRLLRVADYRAIDVSSLIQPFVLDTEALEGELRRMANRHIRWEPGNVVASGDQVVCRLRSACDRFNREKVKFVAGSGMLHRELEGLSVGMAEGETRPAGLPEGRVELTVTGILHRVVPEPSDGMVRDLGLEGVSDLEEYRAYLAAQQKETYLEDAAYEPADYLCDRLLEESEFVLFREDWQAMVTRQLDRHRILARHDGLVLEEMTPEQFDGRVPVENYHQLVVLTQNAAWYDLRMYLVGRHFALTDGFAPDGKDYESYIAGYAKTWRTTPEKAQEIDPYDSYRIDVYIDHAYDVLRQYIKTLF